MRSSDTSPTPPQIELCALCGQARPHDQPHQCPRPKAALALDQTQAQPERPADLGRAQTLEQTAAPGPPPDGSARTPIVNLKAVQEPSDSLIGTVIDGRYQVLEEIGHGGMGVVYRARHLVLESQVAIKVLLSSPDPDSQLRFLREAKLASKVNHPNTVYIAHYGVLADERPYLVMECLQGRTLENEMARGPLLPVRACQIALQITLGLQAVHEKGIVHREV